MTTQTYYLTVLEVRSLKNQGVSRTVFLLEAVGENSFPCFFHLLEAACTSRLVAPPPNALISASLTAPSLRQLSTLLILIRTFLITCGPPG